MKAVVQWVLKTMMKDQTGVMRTLPKKDLVDFNVAITAERLARNGIDPNALKNANQVENAINQIEAPRKQKTIGEARGIRSTESAKVFNIEGKELDPKKPIMGGTQTGKELSPELSERLRGTEVDRIKQKIADKKVETEEEILARLNKDNKKNIDKIKNREMIAEAIDNASPGFVKGDRKYNAQLVAEDLADKKFGKEFYDLDQKQQMDLYGEALDGLSVDLDDFAQGGRAGFSNGGIDVLKLEDEAFKRALNAFKYYQSTGGKKNFRDYIKESGRFGDQFRAEGGRIGYKIGSIDKARRAFLKTVGAVGAGIGALKTGLLGFGKGTTKKVAKEVITTPNAPGKPEWFDALVTKVVNEGTDVTKGFATKERELVHTKQINDFAEVTVYRDLDTNTTTVNYGAALRKDPTKPYKRGNISRAVNDPDQIDLVVKGSEDIEPTVLQNEKGFVRRRGTKSSAEFEAYESEPRVVNYDGDMEFDGTNVVNNVDDLMEDISPLKEYATGKKLTGKEAAKANEKREKYQKFLEDPVEQANYLESKYGPGPEPDDFASGGIARMLGE